MRKDYSIVYADSKLDWPLGYVEFYSERYNQVAQVYYTKYSKKKDEIQKKLYDERWHFARRIQKTHSYSIPKFVLDMKLKGFIKEVVDSVIKKEQPQQLEFQFN